MSRVGNNPVEVPSGVETKTLSPEHTVFQAGGETYHADNGSFYKEVRKDGQVQYVAVDPPFGQETRELPSGAQQFGMQGKSYVQAGGVFFRVTTESQGASYIVVPPPY